MAELGGPRDPSAGLSRPPKSPSGMSIGAVCPGGEQELSPRSALLTQCVFLILQPGEDFASQEFAVHVRELSRNSHLHMAAALWGAGAARGDRAGSRRVEIRSVAPS